MNTNTIAQDAALASVKYVSAVLSYENDDSPVSCNETTKTFDELMVYLPRGAYTGCRTVNRRSILSLETHAKRISDTLNLLVFSKDKIMGKKAGVEEFPMATKKLASFRKWETCRDAIIRLLVPCFKYFDNVNADKAESIWEVKVGIFVSFAFDQGNPILCCHLSPLQKPPQSVSAQVLWQARQTPSAKDSQWVKRRCSMGYLQKEVNEYILKTDEGYITEGAASNVFFVKQGVVYSAPPEEILEGTIWKLVIDVCKEQQITLKYKMFKEDDLGDCEAAFLTSTSRLVLPVRKLVLNEKTTLEFDAESEFVCKIRSKVLQKLEDASFRIY
eukprot:Nk52_evm59s1073 gene=Nk52_evmTU59s1073